jgi:hypothetical protein
MNRRQWLKHSSAAGGALGLPCLFAGSPGRAAQEAPAADGRKLPPPRITDVKTTLTAPAGIRLVVVKVLTNEPGLHGLGCATVGDLPGAFGARGVRPPPISACHPRRRSPGCGGCHSLCRFSTYRTFL